jgi:hypothetical protein
MKSLFRLSLFLFNFLFLFTQCQDKEDTPTIPCLKLFDQNGQAIGTHGDCIGNQDWASQSLTNSERSLLDFEDGLQEVNASDNLSFERIIAYPNPIPKGSPIALQFENSTEEFKVKIVIIDKDQNVVFQQAFLGSIGAIQIQLSDNFIEMSKYFKVLYNYYSDNHGVLFEGSGLLLVCDAQNITSVEEDCF